jgi:predicted membrane channel-forming protein YqfA (hemolysin III family)
MFSRLPRWSVKDLLWITALVAGNCFAVKLAFASRPSIWFGAVAGLAIGVALLYSFMCLLRRSAVRRLGIPVHCVRSSVGFVPSFVALAATSAIALVWSMPAQGALSFSIGTMLFAVTHGQVLLGPKGVVSGGGINPWNVTTLVDGSNHYSPRLRIGRKWQTQTIKLTPQLAQFAIEHGASTEEPSVNHA